MGKRWLKRFIREENTEKANNPWMAITALLMKKITMSTTTTMMMMTGDVADSFRCRSCRIGRSGG